MNVKIRTRRVDRMGELTIPDINFFMKNPVATSPGVSYNSW
jgi:hypothetical protein